MLQRDEPGGRAARLGRRLRARAGIGARRADRVTLGLAALTAITAGSVVAGEFVRRYQRRAARRRAEDHSDDGAVETLQIAGRATQDTVRVAIEGYESASRQEVVLFNLFTGFAAAFTVARLSTGGIRSGWWPFRNIEIGGRHIHHFVPGIVLAFGSGTGALITDSADVKAALALPFGAGMGLTMDEAALLLDLRDVYWSREGVLSVQLSLAGIVLLSGTILALRMLRRGEQRVEEAGLIPDAGGEMLVASPVPVPAEGS